MRNGLNMFAIALVLVCVIFGALGQISMKKGMNQLDRINGFSDLMSPRTAINIMQNWYVMGGLFLYMFSAFLWLGALSTLDVSFMYPLLSLAYVVTAVFAFTFLGETINLVRWTGIALVVLGCVLITRS